MNTAVTDEAYDLWLWERQLGWADTPNLPPVEDADDPDGGDGEPHYFVPTWIIGLFPIAALLGFLLGWLI